MRDATGLRGVLCWGGEEGDDHGDARGGSACRRGRPLLRTSPDLPLVGAVILSAWLRGCVRMRFGVGGGGRIARGGVSVGRGGVGGGIGVGPFSFTGGSGKRN